MILSNTATAFKEFIGVAMFILLIVGMFLVKNWFYRRRVKVAAKILAKEMVKEQQKADQPQKTETSNNAIKNS